MLLPLLLALSVQTAPSLDRPGIILISSGDTVFLTPTQSIEREGSIRQATLVEIYSPAVEGRESLRRDSVVEFDCAAARFRVLRTQEFDDHDHERAGPRQKSGGWAYVYEADTPQVMLHFYACSDTDLASLSYASVAAQLPRIRARLEDKVR